MIAEFSSIIPAFRWCEHEYPIGISETLDDLQIASHEIEPARNENPTALLGAGGRALEQQDIVCHGNERLAPRTVRMRDHRLSSLIQQAPNEIPERLHPCTLGVTAQHDRRLPEGVLETLATAKEDDAIVDHPGVSARVCSCS